MKWMVNSMRLEVNIELLKDNRYKEVEMDIYRKNNNLKKFEFVETLILDDVAILEGELNSPDWILELKDEKERKKFDNVFFIKFMIAVYENTDEKPFPSQGHLLYRIPLIDKIFARPYDCEKRGVNNIIKLYLRQYEKL